MRLVATRRYQQDISRARFGSHRDFATMFEKQATSEVAKGRLARPDLLVATVPPHHAGEAAARVASRLDAELILDQAEWWPEPLRPLLPGPNWLRSVIAGLIFPRLARCQHKVLGQADAVLTASATRAAQVRDVVAGGTSVKIVPTGSYLQDYSAPPPFIDHVPGQQFRRPAVGSSAPLAVAVTGDLDQWEDLLRLVDLARSLSRRQTAAVLHVIGGGRWMSKLATTAPLITGTCQIQAHGLIDRGRYVSLLSSCHAGLLLPGLLQRFPLPAEAADCAAAGLALVVSSGGELAEMVVAEEAGVVSTSATADALTDALAPLADDPRRLSRLRQGARRLAEKRFDRERLAAGVVEWFESLALSTA